MRRLPGQAEQHNKNLSQRVPLPKEKFRGNIVVSLDYSSACIDHYLNIESINWVVTPSSLLSSNIKKNCGQKKSTDEC